MTTAKTTKAAKAAKRAVLASFATDEWASLMGLITTALQKMPAEVLTPAQPGIIKVLEIEEKRRLRERA